MFTLSKSKLITLLTSVVFTLLYVSLSKRVDLNSDYVSLLLEAQDVVKGNILLNGWTLTNISFYVVELPITVLIYLIGGLSPVVMHVVPAIIYTLSFLACVWLLQKQSWIGLGVLIIMIGLPNLFIANMALVAPIHMGTILVMLLAFRFVDQKRYILLGALLCIATANDTLAFYLGVAPVCAVSIIHLWRERNRHDAYLFVSGIASFIASKLVLIIIEALGGFKLIPVTVKFANYEDIPKNFLQALHGLLAIYGSDVFGRSLNLETVFALVHLTALVAVLYFLVRCTMRYFTLDRIDQVLVVGMWLNLLSYALSTMAGNMQTIRYMMPFYFMGAALTARNMMNLRWEKRHKWILAAVLIVYAITFVQQYKAPAKQTEATELLNWLEQKHLSQGYGTFWNANYLTVQSNGAIEVRSVMLHPDKIVPYMWFSKKEWYNEQGNFIVYDKNDSGKENPEKVFGKANEVKQIGKYTVLVWNKPLTVK